MQNRIREIRKSKNMTMKQLGEVIGVAESTISQYETGKRQPDNEVLWKLGEYLGVTVGYLLGVEEERPATGTFITGIRIPVLGYIPAGIPVEAVEEILDWEEIPPEWAKGGRRYFGLKVKGDSMYPKYLDGDTVILRKQSSCDSGDDCAVMVNGDDSTLKQVFFHEDSSMEIRPLNPSYPPRTFSAKEIESLPVSIAGVVVELRRKIK